ncbi:MAG TPA: AAA family ATPase, partial [Labilithrix sp.]
MRIEKLQLLAFGPFRGLELDLGAPGLHVVFGRNEAGKSTTLRAISGLLYGIPHRSPDAHTHKELRVGGVLDGVRIVRRKGTSNTLLDDEGRPIDEMVLLRLLRGVTKETFESAFGLDHVTLEAGAKALLEGRGDLGESLFDAAVGGGGDVQRLVRDLASEADAIYKPQGRALPLNDALRAFAEAQRSVKEKQSLPDSFEKQQRAIEEAASEKEAKAKERADASARKAAIERARKRVPLEKRRVRAAEELASLGAIASHTAHVRSIASRLAAYEKTSKQRAELALEAARLRDRVADAARRAGVDAPDPALRV